MMRFKIKKTALVLALALLMPHVVLAQEDKEEPLLTNVQVSQQELTPQGQGQEEVQVSTQTLTESETELETEVETEAQTEVQTEVQTELRTEAETEVQKAPEEAFVLPEGADRKNFLSAAPLDSVTRISGSNRYLTAVEISKSLFNSAKLVILASGQSYPDALAGSSLSQGRFPILLTEKDTLPDKVKIEIARLKPETILILGGRASISQEIEKNLQKDFNTLRIAGDNRYETAVKIAKVAKQKRLMVASGENFPDALAATGLAGIKDQTLLLTAKDTLPQALMDYLKGGEFERIDFAGGIASISDPTAKAILDAAKNPTTARYSGANRAVTSVELAKALIERTGKLPTTVLIATGQSYPDALAASSISESQLAPILLVEKDYVDQVVIDFLDANRASIQKAVVVGGPETVNEAVVKLLQEAIKDGGKKPALLKKETGTSSNSTGGQGDNKPGDNGSQPSQEKPLISAPAYPGQQKRGSSGPAVKSIQEALARKGYYAGAIDGNFGALTETAVKQFQKENGLQVDGSVGKETWNKLMGTVNVNTGDKREKVVLSGPYVSQLHPVYAPMGFEGASLLMGLKYKGYAKDVDLRTFLNDMPRHDSNPAKGYVGNPFSSGQEDKRTTIYPPKLAEYGRKYGRVRDISGATTERLIDQLYKGNPVVVYVTLFWRKPYYRDYNIEGQWQSLLRNNHVLLLDGYDPATGKYHVSDPYNHEKAGADRKKEFRYWVDKETFEDRYNVRQHALVIE